MSSAPSVGRIVHLSVDNDTYRCVAGIVVGVHTDDTVDVTVFPPHDEGLTIGRNSHTPEGDALAYTPGTWHWPER